MYRDQRDPLFTLLTPLIFAETHSYKCNILIFQEIVHLDLGAVPKMTTRIENSEKF